MRKTLRRKKLIRADLEALLSKYERRIQRISEEAYQVRLLLEKFDAADKEIAEAQNKAEEPKVTTETPVDDSPHLIISPKE